MYRKPMKTLLYSLLFTMCLLLSLPLKAGYPFPANNYTKPEIVATRYDRDALQMQQRYELMYCYVADNHKVYQLRGGITNAHWVELDIASSMKIQGPAGTLPYIDASGLLATDIHYHGQSKYDLSGANFTGQGQFVLINGVNNTVNDKKHNFIQGRESYSDGTQVLISGERDTVQGNYSSALGQNIHLHSHYQFGAGLGLVGESLGEIVLGRFNTRYNGQGHTWHGQDRLLTIGNGTGSQQRSDALIIFKDGRAEFGGEIAAPNLYSRFQVDSLVASSAGGSGVVQNLQLNGTVLNISGGNSVDFTGWDTDASDDFSGDYLDLINKPALFSGSWNDLTNKPTLFSGNYNDLTNKPSLFSGRYNDLTGKPNLFSGSWNDLTDKPTLFTGNYNDLSNKPALFSGSWNDLTDKPNLFSGNYSDLNGKPNLFSGSWNDLTDKPNLFSGDYIDLTNKPNLFSGQYNDLTGKPNLFSGSWNDLTDKPILFSGDYHDLINKPNLFSGDFGDLINTPALYNRSQVDSAIAAHVSSGGTVQTLNLSGSQLSITSGNTVDFSGWDMDASDDFSGDYNDLVNKPNLFSGDFSDLNNLPADFQDGKITWNEVESKPTLYTRLQVDSIRSAIIDSVMNYVDSAVISQAHSELVSNRSLQRSDCGKTIYVRSSTRTLTLVTGANIPFNGHIELRDFGSGTLLLDASAVTLRDDAGDVISTGGSPLVIQDVALTSLGNDEYKIIGQYQ